MMRLFVVGLVCIGLSLLSLPSWSFVINTALIRPCGSGCHVALSARRRRNEDKNSDDSSDPSSSSSNAGIPQLPAIGASSFQSHSQVASSTHATTRNVNLSESAAAFVGSKFQIQYTCKVCDTRNCHLVSRVAYRQGVVVATCKGCDSKHLIADNLGSGGSLAGGTNIEDYFKIKGDEDDQVLRVSQDVFQLEKILDFDTEGGAIAGEDGRPMLE